MDDLEGGIILYPYIKELLLYTRVDIDTYHTPFYRILFTLFRHNQEAHIYTVGIIEYNSFFSLFL